MKSFKTYIQSQLYDLSSMKESLLDDEDDLATDFTKEIEVFITKTFRCPGYKIKRDANGDYIVNCDTVSSKYWETETLTNGLFKWGEVKDFLIDNLWKLKSLEGAPKECRVFSCKGCEGLINLIGGPQYAEHFYCDRCRKLESLEGAPEQCVIFGCSSCPNLKSLKGAPRVCTTTFCCSSTDITSLEGAPRECDVFQCNNCPRLKTLKGAPRRVDTFECRRCDALKDTKDEPKICRSFIVDYK